MADNETTAPKPPTISEAQKAKVETGPKPRKSSAARSKEKGN